MTSTFAPPMPAHAPTRPQADRRDLYAPIHKALRLAMGETLARLGRMDAADPADRDEALGGLSALLSLCAAHLQHENAFVHPAIDARQPGGSTRIAEEHEEHLASIAALREEAASLATATRADADRLGQRLYRHLALFIAENLQHMHIEETLHNALLWELYSDDELDALHGRLMASIGPEEHLHTARWILPACTPAERAAMIAGARAQMPPEALLGVLATVRPHMDAAGWTRLAVAAGVAPDFMA
jgi:hypothetical protein